MQPLETSVVMAVLTASVFQAFWNFYAKKSSSDKMTLLAVGWFALGAVMTPLLLILDPQSLDLNTLTWILLSGFVHTAYLFLLGWGYSIGQVSVVFPIARGLGVAFTAALFLFMTWSDFSLLEAFAIAFVATGALMIGSKEVLKKNTASSVLAALCIGLIICTYSTIDSIGVQKTSPLFFLASMNLLAGLFALPILYKKKKAALLNTIKKHKQEALLISAAGSASYIIILWAYTKSPAPYIVALREVSIVITMLLGTFILKEPLYKRKAGGVLLILVGVLGIKGF